MSYVVTSPQPTGLNPGETSVTLDDGTVVAVSVAMKPQPNNAPSFVIATARQINADGTPKLDAQNQAITTSFPYTPTPDEANDSAALAAAQKMCMMAVLGEPISGPLSDPIHANAIANCSIRNRIAALAIAGPVDAGALL